MKQILTLTRMQLGTALDFIKIFNKKNTKKSVAASGIIIGAFLFFSILIGIYIYGIGYFMKQYDAIVYLPGCVMAITCVISLITTIYKVRGTLFGFKDYDLVMALPVTTSKVVISRCLLLYSVNLFFTLVLMLPCMIVYGILETPAVYYYIYSTISLFFIPLIPLVIASVIGTGISAIASRFKKSNIANIILTILVFVGVMLATTSIQSEEQIVEIGQSISDQATRMYPPVDWYLRGVVEGDLIYLLAFLAASILTLALFGVVLGRFFKKLNTSITSVVAKKKYRQQESKASSAINAIRSKELRRLVSSPMVFVNTSVGALMMLMLAGAVIVMGKDAIVALFAVSSGIPSVEILILGVCVICVLMTIPSASCISLEGKNLWIMTTAPLSANQIFSGKIAASLSISIPCCIIAGIAMGVRLQLEPVLFIAYLILPCAAAYFTACFGIAVNLRFPLLDWKNELVVVKSSVATMIVLFGGMIIGIGILLLLLFTPTQYTQWAALGVSALLLLIGEGLRSLINRNGMKRLQRTQG